MKTVSNYLIDCTCGENHTLLLSGSTGSLGIISNQEYQELVELKKGSSDINMMDNEFVEYCLEQGFLFENANEENTIIEDIHKQYMASSEKEGYSFWITPTFSCNLRCTYCFEGDIKDNPKIMSEDMIISAFSAMEKMNTSEESPILHIYGGEPLLKKNITAINSILIKDR